MVRTFAIAYPWDLIDEAMDLGLDRLHGEIGVEGVSLWVATPPTMRLSPGRAGSEPGALCTHGGVLFQPRAEHYAASRCKPVVCEWVKSRNPLKVIAKACDQRKMQLRVRISAAATGLLARRHPDMASKNVFGTPSLLSVCLANPDLQAYLCGLVADLSRGYKPAGLTVTDFGLGWIEAFSSDLQTATPLGSTERALLFVCSCESCRQKAKDAGVDIDGALQSARVTLQKSLDAGRSSDAPIESVIEDHAELAGFFRWRVEELSSLWRRMRDACDCDLLLDRSCSGVAGTRFAEPDMSLPAAVVTRVEHADGLTSAICPGAHRNELRIPASSTVGPRGSELVSMLAQAVEHGFVGVEIDNYGTWPEAAFAHIRQAIRFAKRTRVD